MSVKIRQRKTKESTNEPMPADVCYCNGKRELGTMELHCNGCKKWFHQKCLRDLKEFYGLPFMVCYVFYCQDCASDKQESWTAKQTNFSHMCIMAMSNMVVNHFKSIANEDEDLSDVCLANEAKFFRMDTEIIPFFEENWESLTPLPRRVKTTWHVTIAKTLAKESELFMIDEADENLFALKEKDLLAIGPMHRAVKNLGRRVPNQSQPSALETPDENEGPKTRGASKRKQVENVLTSVPKRYRTTGNTDASPLSEGVNQNVDAPFNRGELRYYLAEEDPCAYDKNKSGDGVDENNAKILISHHYRRSIASTVLISPNDRAHQLKLDSDGLTITGNGGYAMARATHSIGYGRWYFEIEFLNQPGDSHVRIGWAQSHSVVQACVGYSKFSYGWRSLKGTAFHDGYGHTYSPPGFKQGDTLGCLIDLPDWEDQLVDNERSMSSILPASHKSQQVIKFKNHYFFEEHDDTVGALSKLREVPRSKIEFFVNGRSKGIAFSDIYEGQYYPAISLFHDATIRCNFGPKFRHTMPKNTQPMSVRAEQMVVEQTVADIVDMVKCVEEREQMQQKEADDSMNGTHKIDPMET